MKEELIKRGGAVLRALHENCDLRDMSAARAWERDVVAAYPELEVLELFSEHETWLAKTEVLTRCPNKWLEHGSTSHLAVGEVATLITTVTVRLHRLQHGELKAAPPKKRGRPSYDAQDKPLLKRMHEMITSGKVDNVPYAADAMAEKAAGKTFKSKSKRLERKYLDEYGSPFV